jgi:antitoxin ParD1/3/4
VSKTTMSFALPDEMRRYIDDRVRSGEYGNTSEYLRELIRRDQQHVAERRLRGLIADGIESGNGRPATADVIDEIRQRAFAADT